MITIDNVTHRFKGLTGAFALGPVSVEIPPGKVVFWVGHIGSGKSTLAKLLCRELTPDAGQIKGLNGTAIYHHQSVVDNIFPDITVGDHIRLLRRDKANMENPKNGLLAEVLALANKYPDELSGGQLQWIAFATIMLETHSLYVFDEVFNNLDHAHAAQVMQAIRHIVNTNSDTHCVVITHDLELVREEADMVHVFTEGRITRTLDRRALAEGGEQLVSLVLKPTVASQ
jgi:cell division transport system ATP-binding protein